MNQPLKVQPCVCLKTIVFKIFFISLFTSFISLITISAKAQSMGISSSSITPDASSILELRTTSKGFLIPRMTQTQRDAISAPATGLIIYNTTTNAFNFYNGTSWTALTSGSAGTVTSASVTTANGFAGTVATSTTTPAITISTSVNGMAKGNGTALSAATSGTDYSVGTSGLATGILKTTTGTGALSIATASDFPTLNQNTTGNAATVTTNANLTGEVTSMGNATTVTNAAVIGKVLTGYVSGAGTIAATDNIIQAIEKLNGNNATNANLTGPITSVGNATSIASQTGTGTTFVMNTSPTLVTPNLGTPSTLVGTNITGTAAGLTAGNVTTNANLTGDVTSTGNATTIGAGKVTNAMLAGSIDLTTKVTGILPIANGGTGQSSALIQGGVIYGSSTTSMGVTSAGTAGQVLQSSGTGIPVWVDGGSMMFAGISNNTSVSNTTLYFPISGALAGSTTDLSAGTRTMVSRSGTVSNLIVRLSTGLLSGKTGSVTVYKNGIASALSTTLSVGTLTFSDNTNSFNVVAGDEISIKITTTGAAKFSWAVDFNY